MTETAATPIVWTKERRDAARAANKIAKAAKLQEEAARRARELAADVARDLAREEEAIASNRRYQAKLAAHRAADTEGRKPLTEESIFYSLKNYASAAWRCGGSPSDSQIRYLAGLLAERGVTPNSIDHVTGCNPEFHARPENVLTASRASELIGKIKREIDRNSY